MLVFRVLIVEDNEKWLKRFRSNLETVEPQRLAGMQYDRLEVQCAKSQEEACELLERAGSRGFDLVLLDLCYPERVGEEPSVEETGGFQGMKWLPELRLRQPHAAIVVLTAFPYDNHLYNAVEAVRERQANDFVPKDAEWAHIIWRISMACKNSRKVHTLMAQAQYRELTMRSQAMRVFAEDALSVVYTAKSDLLQLARHIRSGDASIVSSAPDALVALANSLEKQFEEVTRALIPGREPCRETDIRELLYQMALLYDRQFDEAGVRVVGLDASPLKIRTYETDLKVAIHETVSNAVEALAKSHTPEGKRELRMTAERENGGVVVKISDNGDGFSDDAIGHMFEVGRSFEKDVHHRGIGMYIVWRLINGIGGRVEARNLEEGGAEVTLVVKDLQPDENRIPGESD